MSEEKVLTKEIAEQFLKDPEGMDLGKFDGWEEDVIIYLLESTYDIDDVAKESAIKQGVVQLTKARLVPEVALAFGTFGDDSGGFDFNDFKSVEDESAKILADSLDQANFSLEIHLYLNGLSSLTETAAKYLSQIRLSGWLELNGLLEVSEEVACHLSNTSAFLSLAGVEKLSDESVRYLSQVNGLGLTLGLTSMSDKSAEYLSSVIGGLDLNGLKELSDQAAESLSKLEGEMPRLDPLGQPMGIPMKACLRLNGLESLSAAAAKSLATFNGTLELSGLNKLSDKAIALLAEHEFSDASLGDYRGRLELPAKFKAKLDSLADSRLNDLMSKSANILTKEVAELFVSGQISSLEKCSSIDDEAAKILAEQTGDIRLEGLTELNDSTAKIFESHRGEISFHHERESLYDKVKSYKALYALRNMSPSHLANARSNVRLDGLKLLTDDIIDLLAKVPHCLLHLNGLTELSSEHAEFLLSHEGGVSLSDELQKKLEPFSVKYKKTLTLEIAKKYIASTYSVELTDFESIELDAAEFLSQEKNFLNLSGILELNDEVAVALSKLEEGVLLLGLKTLSNESAKSLAKLDVLRLPDKLQAKVDAFKEEMASDIPPPPKPTITLTKKIAELFLEDEDSVDLEKFGSIDEDAAKILASYSGKLWLGGLTELSDESSLHLSKYNGIELKLDGVKEMSLKSIKNLCKIDKKVDLFGLVTASPEVLKAFSEKKGRLILSSDLQAKVDALKNG